jgi:hypothetical protein
LRASPGALFRGKSIERDEADQAQDLGELGTALGRFRGLGDAATEIGPIPRSPMPDRDRFEQPEPDAETPASGPQISQPGRFVASGLRRAGSNPILEATSAKDQAAGAAGAR